MRLTAVLMIMSALLVSPFSIASKIYQCGDGDDVVFQSAPCPELFDFGLQHISAFDGWSYGMNILAVKQKAKTRNLAIAPGTRVLLTNYNEKILNSQSEARAYTYTTTVASKRTQVTLYFTQNTQKLYKITTMFVLSLLPLEERKYFYYSLVRQISEKYGSYQEANNYPAKTNPLVKFILKDTLGTTKMWSTESGNIVLLNRHSLSYTSYGLTYQYLPLVKQSMIETTEAIRIKTDTALIQDSSKL